MHSVRQRLADFGLISSLISHMTLLFIMFCQVQGQISSVNRLVVLEGVAGAVRREDEADLVSLLGSREFSITRSKVREEWAGLYLQESAKSVEDAGSGEVLRKDVIIEAVEKV